MQFALSSRLGPGQTPAVNPILAPVRIILSRLVCAVILGAWFSGPVCADTMLRELADARLVTIRDAGHFVYVEQPAAFRAALTDFLL